MLWHAPKEATEEEKTVSEEKRIERIEDIPIDYRGRIIALEKMTERLEKYILEQRRLIMGDRYRGDRCARSVFFRGRVIPRKIGISTVSVFLARYLAIP